MNYWDNLPRELQNEVRGFLATTIQKIWRGRIARAKQSLLFINELLIEIKPAHVSWGLYDEEIQWKHIDPMLPRTALIVGYCTKYANYLIGGNVWDNFMNTIKYDLWLNEHTGGRGAIYYNEIELDLPVLKNRLLII